MLRKITLVSDLKKLISKNLMCFRTIDPDSPDGKFEYHYVTKSSDFISTVNCDFDDFELSLFDLISGKYIQMENYSAFFGEIFQVAQLTNPVYSDFFSLIDCKSIVVDYTKPVYFLSDFSVVPDSQFGLYDSNGFLKDGLYSKTPQVSNFCEEHFSKEIVYLYLGEESGVKCLSSSLYDKLFSLDKVDNGLDLELPATLKSLDISENEKFFVLKSLAISIEGHGMFFTAINDLESLSLQSNFKVDDDIEYQEDDMVFVDDDIEQDVFELDDDIEYEDEDDDVEIDPMDDDIEYEDDEVEIDPMDDEVKLSLDDSVLKGGKYSSSMNDVHDPMDDEVEFSVSDIDLIDDIDDDLDLGDKV